MPTRVSFGSALAGALLFCLLAACDRSPSQSSLSIGASPFSAFEVANVSELQLIMSAPATGEPWASRLTRSEGAWKIASAPDDRELLDRHADAKLVEHLLDAMRSMKVVARPDCTQGRKCEPALFNFGLKPPYAAIRWTTAEKTYEARVGGTDMTTRGRFLSLPENPGEVWVVSGAAPKLIAELDGFQRLRHSRLADFETDAIDEIEIHEGNAAKAYAQRAGANWQDRENRPLRSDMTPMLEHIANLPIAEFVDDPTTADALKLKLESSPAFRLVLRPRKGAAYEIRVAQVDGRYAATLSSRKPGIFIIDASAAQAALSSLKQSY